MLPTIYTIGHSNLDEVSFLSLLSSHKIETLIDIRSYPQSQRFPQFNEQNLRVQLDKQNILYHWAGRQFGGNRIGANNSRHVALQGGSKRDFADYMDTPMFRQACMQLTNLISRAPAVLMCAEKLPENCHRGMIADYLCLQGIRVLHIVSQSAPTEHILNECARRESVDLVYDRHTASAQPGN